MRRRLSIGNYLLISSVLAATSYAAASVPLQFAVAQPQLLPPDDFWGPAYDAAKWETYLTEKAHQVCLYDFDSVSPRASPRAIEFTEDQIYARSDWLPNFWSFQSQSGHNLRDWVTGGDGGKLADLLAGRETNWGKLGLPTGSLGRGIIFLWVCAGLVALMALYALVSCWSPGLRDLMGKCLGCGNVCLGFRPRFSVDHMSTGAKVIVGLLVGLCAILGPLIILGISAIDLRQIPVTAIDGLCHAARFPVSLLRGVQYDQIRLLRAFGDDHDFVIPERWAGVEELVKNVTTVIPPNSAEMPPFLSNAHETLVDWLHAEVEVGITNEMDAVLQMFESVDDSFNCLFCKGSDWYERQQRNAAAFNYKLQQLEEPLALTPMQAAFKKSLGEHITATVTAFTSQIETFVRHLDEKVLNRLVDMSSFVDENHTFFWWMVFVFCFVLLISIIVDAVLLKFHVSSAARHPPAYAAGTARFLLGNSIFKFVAAALAIVGASALSIFTYYGAQPCAVAYSLAAGDDRYVSYRDATRLTTPVADFLRDAIPSVFRSDAIDAVDLLNRAATFNGDGNLGDGRVLNSSAVESLANEAAQEASSAIVDQLAHPLLRAAAGALTDFDGKITTFILPNISTPGVLSYPVQITFSGYQTEDLPLEGELLDVYRRLVGTTAVHPQTFYGLRSAQATLNRILTVLSMGKWKVCMDVDDLCSIYPVWPAPKEVVQITPDPSSVVNNANLEDLLNGIPASARDSVYAVILNFQRRVHLRQGGHIFNAPAGGESRSGVNDKFTVEEAQKRLNLARQRISRVITSGLSSVNRKLESVAADFLDSISSPPLLETSLTGGSVKSLFAELFPAIDPICFGVIGASASFGSRLIALAVCYVVLGVLFYKCWHFAVDVKRQQRMPPPAKIAECEPSAMEMGGSTLAVVVSDDSNELRYEPRVFQDKEREQRIEPSFASVS